MAKPQLEDGYTAIANEILEHLMKMHLTPNQWQVLLCIIRKTYGFHKKVDYIANFQIIEATGLGKTVVSRVLHNLDDMRLINRKGKLIGIQKDWEKWRELAGQLTSGSKLAEQSTLLDNKSKQNSQPELAIQLTELAEQSTKVSSPRVAQKIKDTLPKDTLGKKERSKKKRYFFDNILLTEDEYNKLVERFGEDGTKDRLEALSLYKQSRGKRYASDYATVLAWQRRDDKEKGGQGGETGRRTETRRLPRPEEYRSPEEIFGKQEDG